MSIKKPAALRATQQTLAAFSPLTVANCELWLDASGSSSVTLVSSAVSQWNDLSGNGRHATQSTANNRPAYSATVNGRNVITFDGTNDSLITGLASATISGYVTMFCVCRPLSTWTLANGNNKTPLFARNVDASASWGIVLQSDGTRLTIQYQWRGIGYNVAPLGPRVDVGEIQLLALRISASNPDKRNCGSSYQVTASPTAGTGGASNRYLTVGEDPTQARYWSDCVAEVLVYSRSLTTAEVLSIEAYLIAKWGITRQ